MYHGKPWKSHRLPAYMAMFLAMGMGTSAAKTSFFGSLQAVVCAGTLASLVWFFFQISTRSSTQYSLNSVDSWHFLLDMPMDGIWISWQTKNFQHRTPAKASPVWSHGSSRLELLQQLRWLWQDDVDCWLATFGGEIFAGSWVRITQKLRKSLEDKLTLYGWTCGLENAAKEPKVKGITWGYLNQDSKPNWSPHQLYIYHSSSGNINHQGYNKELKFLKWELPTRQNEPSTSWDGGVGILEFAGGGVLELAPGIWECRFWGGWVHGCCEKTCHMKSWNVQYKWEILINWEVTMLRIWTLPCVALSNMKHVILASSVVFVNISMNGLYMSKRGTPAGCHLIFKKSKGISFAVWFLYSLELDGLYWGKPCTLAALLDGFESV